MSFFKEIGTILGLDWAGIALGYSIVNYNGEAIYIEGFKKIMSISQESIVLSAGAVTLYIDGEQLAIFNLEGNSIMIKGKIKSVSTSGGRQA